MVFECHHNIQNQPVSTTIPSPGSFHNIPMIRKQQQFGCILKYVLFLCFSRQYHIQLTHNSDTPSTVLHCVCTRTNSQYSCYLRICLFFHPRISSFSQVRQSLIPKHFSLPHICPPQPPTAQPTSLLSPLILSLHTPCPLDSILNTASLPTQPAHYQPKNSKSIV